MRRYHYKPNVDYCPGVNIDRLWSLFPEGVYEKAKGTSDQAPVLDVTKLVIINWQSDISSNITFLYFRDTLKY